MASCQRVATFQFVCLGWVFFRSPTFVGATTMIRRLCTAWGPSPLVRWQIVVVVLGAIGSQYVPGRIPDTVQRAFARLGAIAQGAVLATALLVITTLGPTGVAPFIYYRF